MGDVLSVHSATATVYTGAGQIAGMVLTANAANLKITVYNNTSAAGTIIFEAYISTPQPLVLFFDDRYAPRFSIGCHVVLAAGIELVLWTRRL